jgi:hypothetical protein
MMFSHLLPPLCLLLALAMLLVGFTLIAVGGPEDSVQLHQARAQGDELTTETLETDLRRKQLLRYTLIGLLLLGSGLMTMTAFRSMGSSSQ